MQPIVILPNGCPKQFQSVPHYWINQFCLHIPPLRKRAEDLLLLAYYFLEQYKAQYPGRDIFDFHPDALHFIQGYSWPGNIRELSNSIHRAVLTSKGPLIRFDFLQKAESSQDFESATRLFQKELIERAIECASGNREEAAKRLGLSRSTFFRYKSQLGL